MMNSDLNISSTINNSMISDTLSEQSSDSFDESDILTNSVSDDVTATLAAAGPVGMAAAAAIATARRRKRPHSFETNPSVRRRQQTRLLRKLKNTIAEYTTRVGQQAVILCCTPGKGPNSANTFRVFGCQPLETVIRNCRQAIMQDLENSLAAQAPPQVQDNPSLHELPALSLDGIPTPVNKMTQAQLRAFIPEMLKYSTGRSKPGWGKMECRPVWWPNDVPWANVRSDVRTEEEKKKVSWTHALRTIVHNCYKHHGREDLLPDFDDHLGIRPDGHQGTVVQTINNPDGTISIVQIDSNEFQNPQIVTLSDGTHAQVVHAYDPSQLVKVENGLSTSHQPATAQAVQTITDVHSTPARSDNVGSIATQDAVAAGIDVSSATGQHVLTNATINSDGQIILTGDANSLGSVSASTISGIMTIPVSMYQNVVGNMMPDTSPAAQVQLPQGNIIHVTPQSFNQPSSVVNSPQAIQIKSTSGASTFGQPQIVSGSATTIPGIVPDATNAVEIMTADNVTH